MRHTKEFGNRTNEPTLHVKPNEDLAADGQHYSLIGICGQQSSNGEMGGSATEPGPDACKKV